MRLVGIAVLSLLVFAFIAVLVDNRSDIMSAIGIPGSEQVRTHVFETADAEMPVKSSQAIQLPVRQYGRWIALAGFSARQTFDLALPRSTQFDQAVVALDLRIALEENTTGRLRFAVNGEQRGQIVLEPDETDHRVMIPLRPQDYLRKWVTVTVSAEGNNPQAECTADWTGAVVVTVEPTTHVSLVLREPVSDLLDQILISGAPARLIWNEPRDGEGIPVSQLLPWPMINSPEWAVFVDPDDALESDVRLSKPQILSLSQLSRERQSAEAGLTGAHATEWPRQAIQPSAGSAAREFRNRAVWAFGYSQATMPEQRLPDEFNLDLTATSSDDTLSWLLLVTLNGRIVWSERIPPNVSRIQRSVQLPTRIQGLENEVRVSLTSDEEKVGRCVQGRPAVAELLESSNFNRGLETTSNSFEELFALTTDRIDVYVDPVVDAYSANFSFFALSSLFRYNMFHRAEAEVRNSPLHNTLVALTNEVNMQAYFEANQANLSGLWVAFTAVTGAVEPELMLFRADDSRLSGALQFHQPPGVLLLLPPGSQI